MTRLPTALAALLAAVTFIEPAQAANSDSYYRRHKVKYDHNKDFCLHARSSKVVLRKCVKSPDQVWFMTPRGEIRNAKKKSKCLTAPANGDEVRMTPCAMSNGSATSVPRNQKWTLDGKEIKNRGKCLMSRYAKDVEPVRLRDCPSRKNRKYRFTTNKLNNTLRAKHLADMGFPDFSECRRIGDEVKSDCRLNAKNWAIGWGFRYGTKQRPNINPGLLDLDERYSVERCALAHDAHWTDDVTSGSFVQRQNAMPANRRDWWAGQMEWVHFINCLKRVKPSNEDEAHARKSGIKRLPIPVLSCAYRDLIDGDRARAGWGELRPRTGDSSSNIHQNAASPAYPGLPTYSGAGTGTPKECTN